MLKGIKKFASTLLQGIDEIVDKNQVVINRSLYDDVQRQKQIGEKMLEGAHTLDNLIELEMIDKKHNPKR